MVAYRISSWIVGSIASMSAKPCLAASSLEMGGEVGRAGAFLDLDGWTTGDGGNFFSEDFTCSTSGVVGDVSAGRGCVVPDKESSIPGEAAILGVWAESLPQPRRVNANERGKNRR